MRIGVIRGDMPGPIVLADLETVSQHNPPTEPRGQELEIDRPNPALLDATLATVQASIIGTTDVSSGDTIDGTNDALRVRIDAGDSFTTVAVAQATYNDAQELADALNTALSGASVAATATPDATDTFLILSADATGPGSYVEVDSAGNGSEFNAVVGWNAAGESSEVPDSAGLITALAPVGGPLDVSLATLQGISATFTAAQATTIADVIAPQFVETDVAVKSFQVGMVSGYRSASYNPDPNRLPAGAAIEVVADDGSTPFSAPLTAISSATADSPNAGDITIAGTNLGNPEVEATVVKVLSSDGTSQVKLYQSVIASTLTGGTQGSVTATSIVIPASLLNGLGAADSTVQVQYTSLASDVEVVA